MTAIFENDLKYSIEDFETRKKFYIKIGYENPAFVDFDTSKGKELQLGDIDVTAVQNGRGVGISEKIRRFKYRNDILIEMWSVFEKNVPGWLKNSKADTLANFFYDKIIMIDVPSLKDFLHKFAKENNSFVSSVRDAAKKMISCGKIFARLENFRDIFVAVADNDTYHTVSVIFKTRQLQENGVEMKEYETE